MSPDNLLIKNAKLRDQTDLVNISILDGKVREITQDTAAPATVEILMKLRLDVLIFHLPEKSVRPGNVARARAI